MEYKRNIVGLKGMRMLGSSCQLYSFSLMADLPVSELSSWPYCLHHDY